MPALRDQPSPTVRERTTLIGDAAIEVLAAEGSRGLTHRAVDRYLNWPEGTTSRFFRTRDALMTAVVDRLIEVEVGYFEKWWSGVELEGPISRDEVAGILASAFTDWIKGGNRQLARYALSLEGLRRPAVQAAIVEGRTQMNAVIGKALVAAGIPDGASQATILVSAIDGLCHDYLLHPPIAIDPRHIESIVRRWFCSTAGG